jgi:hypothetical protein
VKTMASSGPVPEAPARPPSKRDPILQWPASIAFNLAVSLIVGLIYALIICGLRPLDPRDISWMQGDSPTYFVGWELFRQDPHLHWPLTFTNRVGYPLGASISLMDPIPLLALIFKPLSPILPAPFQYLGISVILACTLQFFFSLLIFRFLLDANPWAVVLSSVFLLIAPPLTFRLTVHYALANQWILLAAIYLLITMTSKHSPPLRPFRCYGLLLAFIATAINPYLAFLTLSLLLAALMSVVWQGRLSIAGAVGMIAGLAATCGATAAALGLFSGLGGDWRLGYRLYSMNLLAPIDPYAWKSVLLPQFPQFTTGQFEGYNYMGAGVILLAIISLPFVWLRRRVFQLSAPQVVPLALCCLVLTVMAASTQITVGNRLLFDLDPAEHLSRFLAPLRVSGRLFWVPYYVILIAILASVFRIFASRTAIVLVAIALAVQIVDTASVREAARSSVSAIAQTPLKSPIWSALGDRHRNLLILPAWQCDQDQTPGADDGFRIFGLLAVAQRMRSNSYYAARYSDTTMQYHCSSGPLELMRKPLSPDSVYVVNAAIAALIELGPSGAGKCHEVDGFILCSSANEFGLNSNGPNYLPQMDRSNRIAVGEGSGPNRFLLTGWYNEPGAPSVWSDGDGVLAFVVGNGQRSRYAHMTLHLKALVGRDPLQYSVISSASVIDGTVPGLNTHRIVDLNLQIPLGPGSIQHFEIVTRNPPRPFDIGVNLDPRKLGLGFVSAQLTP